MTPTRFGLVRHAPVAGPTDIVHATDAQADISDRAALHGLARCLPNNAPVYASPRGVPWIRQMRFISPP